MSTHNICLYKEVKKKYTGCNLKTTEFLDCALIGVCAVIRSNTVVNNCLKVDAWASFNIPIVFFQMRIYNLSFCRGIRKIFIVNNSFTATGNNNRLLQTA